MYEDWKSEFHAPPGPTLKQSLSIILIIIAIIIAGWVIFLTLEEYEPQIRNVDVNEGQIEVYKAQLWTSGEIEISIDLEGNGTVLISILNEENFEKQSPDKTPVYILNKLTNKGDFAFKPEFGKTYYIEIGNPSLGAKSVDAAIPKIFKHEGTIGLPDSDLY